MIFFSPSLGGGRGCYCFVLGFVFSFAFVFIMFTVHGVWKGGSGKGGTRKEQMRVLDGPLRGLASMGKAGVEYGQGGFCLEAGLPSPRAHVPSSCHPPVPQ